MTQMTDIDPRDAAGAFGYDASLPRRARAVDIALGAAMIVAGVLAIALPVTSSLAVIFLLGAAFAVLAATGRWTPGRPRPSRAASRRG